MSSENNVSEAAVSEKTENAASAGEAVSIEAAASGTAENSGANSEAAGTEAVKLEKKAGPASGDDECLVHDGPLFHKRATPLPTRIKTGRIGEETLEAESASSSISVKWEDIEYVALGMIQERSEQDANAYKIQRLVKNMGRIASGTQADEKDKIISYKSINYLDIFCRDREEPLRFDSSFINYRSFLGARVSHVSFQNYFRLVHGICSHCRQARFTQSVQAFLNWKRDKVKVFQAVHDFENDTFIVLSRGTRLLNWEDLNFSRDSWAEGWQQEGGTDGPEA